MVRIDVLGPLRAEVGGRPVDLGSPRQRAVLARLISAAGQVVPVERFVDDLWHGEPPPKALGALQVYISNLRRVLEPDRAPRTPARVLVSAAPGYALRIDPDAVDASRFERLLAAADQRPAQAEKLLDDALRLWTGPAYAEFADEAWAVPEAERLAELRRVAFEARASAALDAGHAAQVIPDLELHVRAHPLREDAVALLALACYRAGRQADALAVLRAAKGRLAGELGVDPGPGLRDLEAAVLAQSPALDSPAARPQVVPAAPVSVPPRSTLIGRSDELATLRAAADAARLSGFRVVWLGGEPGAGKTTLAAALRDELAAAGWTVAAGRCPEVDGAPPGWAWAEVVTALVPAGTDVPAGLAPLLAPDSAGAGAAQFWVARALADLLAGADRPALVVLDDLHRADGETLQLLRHLHVELADRPVLVVGTFRPTEADDELQATWAALAGPRADRLTLDGLTGPDVAELLRRHGAGSIPADTVSLLARRTGGNPLFVSETARLIAAEGIAAATRSVPAGVRDVLRRRIGGLPSSAQGVLREAAVLGVEIDVDVLLALQPVEDTVLDGLEVGVATGLITEPERGPIRFAHALIRDTLYEDIPRLRRTRLHGRVLDVLETRQPHDIARLAHHALAAATPGTAGRAAELAAAAAGAASAASAHQRAADLLDRALALDLDDPLRMTLLCGLISAQSHTGAWIEARSNRDRALAVADRLGGLEPQVRAFVAFDAPAIWSVRDFRTVDTAAVARLDALLTAALPVAARIRLLAVLAIEVEGDGTGRAHEVSAEALALAREHGDPALLCRAINARYFAAMEPERRGELGALGTELLAAADRAGLAGYQAQAHQLLFLDALTAPDLDAAQRHVDQALTLSTSGQLGALVGVLGMFGGLRALIAGDFDLAEERYAEAGGHLGRVGAPNAPGVGMLASACVAAARNRQQDPRFALLAEQAAELYRNDPVSVADPYAWMLAAAGRTDEARRVWLPDTSIVTDYYWLLWAALRAEVAIALQDRAVAAVSYPVLLPHTGQFPGLDSGSVTLGPIDHTLGELAQLLGRPAREHFAAAVAAAERIGATHWARRAATAMNRVSIPRTSG